MNFADYSSAVLKEIEQTLKQVDGSKLSEFSVQLWQSPKLFVTGAGRTGLVMRCFAMRLMHLGLLGSKQHGRLINLRIVWFQAAWSFDSFEIAWFQATWSLN